MRYIGTGLRDPDHRCQDVADTAARPAVAARHPQAQYSRAAQRGECVVLQHPISFGGGVGGAQLRDDRDQRIEARGNRDGNGVVDQSHRFS